jgi:hypothetical protein
MTDEWLGGSFDPIAIALADGAIPLDRMPNPLALPPGKYVATSIVTCVAAGDGRRINLWPGDRLDIVDERRQRAARLALWAMADA